jgi:hypothetical protein
VISLFAALFAGSGVATAAPLAEAGSFDLLFGLAALVAHWDSLQASLAAAVLRIAGKPNVTTSDCLKAFLDRP